MGKSITGRLHDQKKSVFNFLIVLLDRSRYFGSTKRLSYRVLCVPDKDGKFLLTIPLNTQTIIVGGKFTKIQLGDSKNHNE